MVDVEGYRHVVDVGGYRHVVDVGGYRHVVDVEYVYFVKDGLEEDLMEEFVIEYGSEAKSKMIWTKMTDLW